MIARIVLGLSLLAAHLGAHAAGELDIKITEGRKDRVPIAIVPFRQPEAAPPVDVSEVIAADLDRSGLFRPELSGFPGNPHEPEEIDFEDWRRLGIANLVIGSVDVDASGWYTVKYRLYNVFKRADTAGGIPEAELAFPFHGPASDLRSFAHRIADAIYERLTGVPGAFNTRIAYVTEIPGTDGKTRYSLNVADSDGFAKQSILESPQPLLSPNWSPDGRHLGYVSYEKGAPHVFVQNIVTGEREAIAHFPGINSAPAFSPDGKQLAMTLSKDGNPEIYIYDLPTRRFRRLTKNASIDTEPAWAPDGQSLIFTSDRSGKPQIYRVPVAGGDEQRLTFEGEYNARASFAPSGELITFVHGRDARFRIATLDLANSALNVLTDSRFDESPSFAPNGSMILYATMHPSGGSLAAVSVDGQVRQQLHIAEGDVREPAWSPYLKVN